MYDSWAIKTHALDADIPVHIPSKKNAVEPWPIDEDAYKDRNRIEHLGKADLLYLVAEIFATIDLHPETVSNAQMGPCSRN